jgi:hypothetical protein
MGDAGEDARKPFAVCAPGMGVLVELALLLSGEPPMEVRETPLLEGGQAYIVTPPDFGKLTPPLVVTPGQPGPSVLRAREFARTFVQPPAPFRLGSIA